MLPAVDFESIKATAQEAIALYGTAATFTEQGATSGRMVKCVDYKGNIAESLVQDVQSLPAQMLLSPADFQAPNRFPQQFDTLTIDLDGFKRIHTIDALTPVFAADKLALLIATIRGN